MDLDEHSDTDDANGDGEGVWSPDIEQCFREALLLFPPCGRRKHILQEEGGGKMYGRNELIARHIRMRTGKIRTRKQVSSHIQVLARRKAKADSSKDGSETGAAGSSSPGALVTTNNASMGNIRNRITTQVTTHSQTGQRLSEGLSPHINQHQNQQQLMTNTYFDIWGDRPIVTKKIRLVEFSAFIEYRRQLQHTPLPMVVSGGSNSPAVALASLATTSSENINQPNNLTTIMSGEPLTSYNGNDINGGPLCQNQTTHNPLHTQHYDHHYVQNANSQTQQPLNDNQHHQQQINQRADHEIDYMLSSNMVPTGINYPNQSSSTSIGFTRHSYVKIDYRQAICRQTTKLERIDISQIQDKFPEIIGPEGLYNRGPSDAFFLVKFWADLSNDDYEYNIEDQNSYFGFSCHFETLEPYKDITCSSKACSYGLQVVEKVEKVHGALNNSNGRYSYDIDRSPMCEFMIQFIKKLRQLPRTSQMNSVLENFTVLQVVTSESTSEILLCLAFVFEVASLEQNNGSQYHVYKLTKD